MKTKALLLATLFFIVPGVLMASPLTYVMVTDDVYRNGSQLQDASLIFRVTVDDKIREYSGNGYSTESPVVSLAPGDTLPTDKEYFNLVTNWSVSFHGDLADLGVHDGGAGGFRWWIEDNMEGGKDWIDAWAQLYGKNAEAQFPAFWWDWNFQNADSGDYLLLPASMLVSGHFGDFFLTGRFDPVPEPSGILLLITTICAWPIMKRKFSRNA